MTSQPEYQPKFKQMKRTLEGKVNGNGIKLSHTEKTKKKRT